MAYIDPDGMFGGDRMALLSDSAKFAWPWFWCASNTLGRVELNYREFVNGPFRQFRKPPTEKQFWEWVAEFHECFLLFAYQVNGQAWGQWDVSERYLPKYKLASDKRAPAPIAADYLGWRDQYQNRKISALSSKCRVFNNSENFQNVSEVFQSVPIGSGNGSGNGIGEELKPLSAADAAGAQDSPTALFAVEPGKATEAWLVERHDEWYYTAFWNRQDRERSRKAYTKAARELMRNSKLTAEQAIEFLKNAAIADKERFRDSPDWEWRQNLHPTTWLNGKRWNDQPKARDPTSTRPRNRTQEALERIDRV